MINCSIFYLFGFEMPVREIQAEMSRFQLDITGLVLNGEVRDSIYISIVGEVILKAMDWMRSLQRVQMHERRMSR